MHRHPNARLTQKGCFRLMAQHLEHGPNLRELAAENGISLRCAYRLLARFRAGGPASLADRRSVRRTSSSISATSASCSSSPSPASSELSVVWVSGI